MARKIIKSGVEAREALTRGAEKLAKAVGETIGPFGQNWFLDKKDAITNDGVSIAREFNLQDEVEQRGVKAIRESAIKTVEEAGDGTSTAIVLANSIYQILSRQLSKDGVVGRKPIELIKQVESEKREVIQKLIDSSTPIETEEQLINSAIVSTEDKDLGALIGGAQWKLGPNGYLLAEETAELSSSVEIVKGIRIDNGFGTSQLINNQEKQILDVSDCGIILTSHTMRDLKSIETLINQFLKTGKREIIIVARAWTEEGIKVCLENINRGLLKVYPISAPYYDMQERFKDLAALTGARFYDSESSSLEDMQITEIGYVSKMVARRFDAIFTGVDDDKTKKRIENRLIELKEKLKGSQSEFEKKSLSERIAQLEDGFGLIKVGSTSDMDRKRLFDKAEDAVNAVRAAYQEGTVKGGGLAFKEISDTLPDTYLLKRPLCSIYEQIMSSAPSDFVIEDWVRDPVKVLRIALERACSAAASFATATGVITNKMPSEMDEFFKTGARNQDE